MKESLVALTLLSLPLLSGCGHIAAKPALSDGHIQAPAAQRNIPEPVGIAPVLPEPAPLKSEPTHTVVVNGVPVRELLFSIARDSDLNLDIDSDVEGLVTLNAINQPLSAILTRITESNDLRFDIKNDVLRVKRDKPFIRNYRIDYLNITRNSRGSVSVSTQISATGQGAGGEFSGGTGNNNSATSVTNISDNSYWDTLQKNIAAILNNTSAEMGPEAQHPDIMLNRESGLLGVRANFRQHQEIQKFIDEIAVSSQRQVLIEATIAEVKLSDRYQAGIDWSQIKVNGGKTTELLGAVTDTVLFNRPSFNLQLTDVDDNGDTLQATLSALETFGDVSVMSSPKIMALNNQTALLKVVDNIVYFTVDVNIDNGTADEGRLITYETEIHTVPVGFVMSVTPFISEYGVVTLNVRPTISRVIGQARDPNPAIVEGGVVSEIPIIQVREVESVLKVSSGDIAVMGGLMQDEVSKNSRGVPLLSKLPYLGRLFRYDDNNNEKTELVIFIKPIVVNRASVEGELQAYSQYLPVSNNAAN